MPIGDYKINVDKADEGEWLEFSSNSDDTIPRFKLARMYQGNKKYQAALKKATAPVRKAIEMEMLSDEKATKISLRVFVDTILLDWQNVQPADDGVELPFTTENALELLEDPAWRELYNTILEFSQKVGNKRSEQLETEAKN